jgi:hypothetical protein
MRLPRPVSSVTVPLMVILLLALPVWYAVGPGTSGRTAAPRPVDRSTVAQSLEHLTTVPRRIHVLGYSRDHFGGWAQQWWKDPGGDPDGHTGAQCSTRHVVMLHTFDFRSPGDEGSCPTPVGLITDVYTGEPLSPDDVEIDHVVPLSAAWDHGAWAWNRAERVSFANDLDLNLLAVASAVNQAKSDAGLGEWLPPTAEAGSLSEAGCAYAARYLAVCLRYELTVSDDDATTARQSCGM